MIFPNGTTYKGNFKKGKFNGLGELTLYNGEIQSGIFENGKFMEENN